MNASQKNVGVVLAFLLIIGISVFAYNHFSQKVGKQKEGTPVEQPGSGSGSGNGTGVDYHRLKIVGSKLYSGDDREIILRGYNWGWWDSAQESDAVANKAAGATVVRMPIRWYFGGDKSDIRKTGGTCNITDEGLAKVDQYIAWATKQKLWVVLFLGSDQGAGDADQNYWTDSSLRKEYMQTWSCLASRYKDTPYIAAYELLSEPHPKKPYTDADVRSFYEEAIKTVRAVDPDTPVMIGPNEHYEISLLPSILTRVDNKVIYTFNFYNPPEYVKQTKVIDEKKIKDGRKQNQNTAVVNYPGTYKELKGGATITLNKEYLAKLLSSALTFRDKNNVPIFVNQVGLRSAVPDSTTYISDVLSMFNENKIGFTYWTYRVRGNKDDIGIYYQEKNGGPWEMKSDWKALIEKYFK